MTIDEQIKDAQAEMATWSPEKRANVRLEGTDFWHEKTLKYLAEMKKESNV